MGDRMDHTLICPNQVQTNGVIVDDIPWHLSHSKSSTHSIYFPNKLVWLPLCLKGIISYLSTRYPTDTEVNECQWLVVTGDSPWNPYDNSFAEMEASYTSTTYNDHPQPTTDRDIMPFHSTLFRNISALTSAHRNFAFLMNISRKYFAVVQRLLFVPVKLPPKRAYAAWQITWPDATAPNKLLSDTPSLEADMVGFTLTLCLPQLRQHVTTTSRRSLLMTWVHTHHSHES